MFRSLIIWSRSMLCKSSKQANKGVSKQRKPTIKANIQRKQKMTRLRNAVNTTLTICYEYGVSIRLRDALNRQAQLVPGQLCGKQNIRQQRVGADNKRVGLPSCWQSLAVVRSRSRYYSLIGVRVLLGVMCAIAFTRKTHASSSIIVARLRCIGIAPTIMDLL
jgi:hypothetical protein